MEFVIKDAATLAVRLAETGTGESKIDIIRGLLAANPNATAMEAVAAMQDTGTVTQATIDKALQLIETGRHEPRQELKPLTPEQRILQERKAREAQKAEEEAVKRLAKAEATKLEDEKAKVESAKREAEAKAKELAEAEKTKLETEKAKAAEPHPEAPGPKAVETPTTTAAPGPQKPTKTGK
jgi:hypothetical protein